MTVNGIWLAALVDFYDSSPRPIAIQLWTWVDDGMIFVEPIALRLGKIPIPVLLFKGVTSELQEKASGADAIVPLIDDREVDIQAITLEDGALVLTCQTQLPK